MKRILKTLLQPAFIIPAIYLLVPFDFIPDAVPVVGTVDDLAILGLTLVLNEYRQNR